MYPREPSRHRLLPTAHAQDKNVSQRAISAAGCLRSKTWLSMKLIRIWLSMKHMSTKRQIVLFLKLHWDSTSFPLYHANKRDGSEMVIPTELWPCNTRATQTFGPLPSPSNSSVPLKMYMPTVVTRDPTAPAAPVIVGLYCVRYPDNAHRIQSVYHLVDIRACLGVNQKRLQAPTTSVRWEDGSEEFLCFICQRQCRTKTASVENSNRQILRYLRSPQAPT